MLRELFHIGPVTVYGYGMMIAIGVISCVLVAMRRAKRLGVDPDILFNAAFIGIVVGIIGSKVTYWITIFPEIIENPRLLLDISGGFVVYGGLIAGLLAAVIYLKAKKQTVLDKLDIAVASISLAQGFGRIGCFLAGCCYGKTAPEGAWYAVVFPASSECMTPGVGVYPTQLMSSGFNFLLFILLAYLTTRVRFRGAIVSLYMMIYSFARFFIEYIRTEPVTVGPFTSAQFTAIFVFAGGVILWFVMRKLALPPLRPAAAGEAEETADETTEKAAEETAEETVEETAEEVAAEKTAEEVTEAAVEETAEEVTEAAVEETAEEPTDADADETAEAAAEDAPEDAAKEAPEDDGENT